VHIKGPGTCAKTHAFVKNTKGHPGYFGCDKGSQEGEYVAGGMTFPENAAELHTDHTFCAMMNYEHHNGQSPLTKLSVDMITAFPLDYMHLICLGVMRKLLYLWIKALYMFLKVYSCKQMTNDKDNEDQDHDNEQDGKDKRSTYVGRGDDACIIHAFTLVG